MGVYELPLLKIEDLLMPKIEKELQKTKTPIERIFFDIVKREMTPKERRILLSPPDKTRNQQ
jgi:hypothetical protein